MLCGAARVADEQLVGTLYAAAEASAPAQSDLCGTAVPAALPERPLTPLTRAALPRCYDMLML